MQRGLLGLVRVGNEPCEEMRQEIVRAAMTGVLDLADVLELVVDTLDDRPLTQQQLVSEGQDPLAHVLTQLGDQHEALGREQLLGERLGDIAAIPKQLAEEAAHQTGNRAAVIDVAWRQTEGQQFATVVDDEVELEAVEPADRGLAPARVDPKDAMLRDAARCGRCGRRRERSSRQS